MKNYSHLRVDLGVEGRLGHLQEDAPQLGRLDLDLDGLQDFEGLVLGELEPLGDDARMEAFADVQLGLVPIL
jgi:hypothetical protein